MPRLSALTVAFFGNIALAISKGVVGWSTGSQALVADGVHSLGDVLSSIFGAVGARLGNTPPDEDHPYGHGNAENLAALLVAVVMAITGYELLDAAALRFRAGVTTVPAWGAAGAAAAACVAKELMHRHARQEAAETHSPAVQALAKDHRSDVLSSLAALIGASMARLVHPILDPMASVVIAGLVLKMAWETLTENVDVLMDREPELDGLKAALRTRAGEDPEVAGLGAIRIHQVGAALNLEVDLRVQGEMTVTAAHDVAHRVEDYARELEPRVQVVQVHVEPEASSE